jgi:hypothetical protein
MQRLASGRGLELPCGGAVSCLDCIEAGGQADSVAACRDATEVGNIFVAASVLHISLSSALHAHIYVFLFAEYLAPRFTQTDESVVVLMFIPCVRCCFQLFDRALIFACGVASSYIYIFDCVLILRLRGGDS